MSNRTSVPAAELTNLFTLNSDPEAIRIGMIYISLSVFMIPFYAIFNWVMWTDKDINKMMIFRLMNQINIIDCAQLACHFVSGFFPIYPEINHRYRFFSSFVGSTVNSLWQAMFPYLCVLSITRVLVIKKKMSPRQQLLPPLKIALALGWMFTFFVWLWSWFGMAFVFGDIGWEYDFSKWSSIYLKIIEIAWCWPAIFVCYFLHLGMILIVTGSKHHNGSISHRHEKLIFCQATILNGWMLGLMVAWHGSDILGLTSNYQLCIINCVWILFSYVNPLLLFVLNKYVFLHDLAILAPLYNTKASKNSPERRRRPKKRLFNACIAHMAEGAGC